MLTALLLPAAIRADEPPLDCAAVPPGAVVWWRAESNTVDSVGVNDAFLGDTRLLTGSYTAYTAGKVGAAFLFSSSFFPIQTPWLFAPASPDLNLGAGDGLTVEGWVRPASVSGVQPLIEWNDGRGNIGAGLALNGSVLEALLTDTNATTIRRIALRSTVGTVVASAWQHVALTFDRASGLLNLYAGGVSVAQTNVGALVPQTQATVYLGYRPSGTNSGTSYRGGLDEMTIYNRALPETELQAIVTAGEAGKCLPPPPQCLPPPTDFVGWWRGESNVLDSVDASPGVITNSVSYTTGVVGRAIQFNNGFVRIPAASNLNVGAGPGLTIESWIFPAFSSSRLVLYTSRQFVGWHSGIITQGVSLSIVRPTLTTGAVLWEANLVDTDGHAHVFRSPSGFAPVEVWQHVAVTYDKASGAAALFQRQSGDPDKRGLV